MKIGIFGDSYVDKNTEAGATWWSLLSKYGHDIQCFGESASSILFSAKKILEKKNDFDLVIWCTTQPGRQSYTWPNKNIHFQIAQDFSSNENVDLAKKFKIWKLWWYHVMDWDDEKIYCRSIIEMVQNRCPHLLIIPGFFDPLDSEFNLHAIFKREVELIYGGFFSDDFYRDYQDERVNHLTQASHEILAECLSKQLQPGIFYTTYEKFPRYAAPNFIRKKK